MRSFYQVCMSYSIIKHCDPSNYICSQSYYNWHQVLNLFMYMIHNLGVITVEFSSDYIIDIKHVSLILHGREMFYLAVIKNFYTFCQYLLVVVFSIHSQTSFSDSPAKPTIHFLLLFFPITPSYLPKYRRGNTWYFSKCW